MTITLDSWQPLLVAVIGALAALGVPVVTAILANRNAKRAAATAIVAVHTASEVSDKVDSVARTLNAHAEEVSRMGTKLDGERTALQEKVTRMERDLIEERRRAKLRNPDGG